MMYFRQNEQVSICDMKMKQFQTFVRERYKLMARTMDDVGADTQLMYAEDSGKPDAGPRKGV